MRDRNRQNKWAVLLGVMMMGSGCTLGVDEALITTNGGLSIALQNALDRDHRAPERGRIPDGGGNADNGRGDNTDTGGYEPATTDDPGDGDGNGNNGAPANNSGGDGNGNNGTPANNGGGNGNGNNGTPPNNSGGNGNGNNGTPANNGGGNGNGNNGTHANSGGGNGSEGDPDEDPGNGNENRSDKSKGRNQGND